MTGHHAEAVDPRRLSLRREILEAERALYRAQIAGNVDDLRPMLGANLVYIHSTGVAESREAYLDGSPVETMMGFALDASFVEQRKILKRCRGLFYLCAGGAEARRFNRLLIDAGLIQGF